MKSFIRWLAIILIPVIIVLSIVQLLLNPWFIKLEYNTPNFPRDPFGFSYEERLHWANQAINFLKDDLQAQQLKELTFDDGQVVFNSREYKHLEDVYNAIKITRYVLLISIAFLFFMILLVPNDDKVFVLRMGGWLTLGLMGLLIATIAVSFGALFIGFHEVLFKPGTWMFLYTDTLIRLFPEKFWRDAFLYVSGGSVLAGGLLAWFFRGRTKAGLNENSTASE